MSFIELIGTVLVISFTIIFCSLRLANASLHYHRLKYDVNGEEFASYILDLTPHMWLQSRLRQLPSSSNGDLNISNLNQTRQSCLGGISLVTVGLFYRVGENVLYAGEKSLFVIPGIIMIMILLYVTYRAWFLGRNMGKKKRQ